ncbi:MAG: SdpI family protein [Clostridia bacterium]|nr:SdpI family protein [Clostridia bacterium]
MKLLRGIIAMLPLAVTAAVLPFMPESVPMHYDINGAVERMGSRYELLLLPLLIMVIVAVSVYSMKHYAERADGTENDTEAKAAKANAKMLNILSLAVPAVFGALQIGILYMTYRNAKAQSVEVNSELIARLTFVLIGIMCVVFGFLMPNTARNHIFGLRVTWSLYNDNTWRRSNRFGGIVFMIIGLLMIVTSSFVPATALVFLVLGYLLVGTVVSVAYAYKSYKDEISAE